MTAPVQPVAVMKLELASGFLQRLVGLLSRSFLDPNTALLIAPCNNVHTFFMRFTIDVVFVDEHGLVVKIVRGLKPFRVAVARGAFCCLELAAGGADRFGLDVGQRIGPVAARLAALQRKVNV